MNNRDNFPPEVVKISKLQAAFICSRPTCRRFTIAPSLSDDMLVQYNGKVAHIAAAAPGGPRYDQNGATERARISNAIFLCSNCADLIDKNNGKDYSVETLKNWKETHRRWVLDNLNKADSSDTTITSHNQSGGITANTVNINTVSQIKVDENRKHDIDIFLKSTKVLNEDQMHNFYSNLNGDGACLIEEVNRIDNICQFFKKTGNSFINPQINEAKLNFVKDIGPLTNFIHLNFDKWPYNQQARNFNIQLKPDYLRDTMYKQMKIEDRQKWDVLFDELKTLLSVVFDGYNNFRKSIKHELYL
ncbi:MAG: hypothetical protein JWP94_1152 [Mucilaginibacter sp.]|nr:hypothetical protein [Mucilaginibacter sp.]